MGTCELCGADNVSTYKTSTSGARVDACNRCIDRLGLTKPVPTPNRIKSQKTTTQTRITGQNIMLNSDKDLSVTALPATMISSECKEILLKF